MDWAAEYDGQPLVVYGHTVAERPEIINRTVDIDQGGVYGGYLTALRYPEIEFVQVRGKKYSERKSIPMEYNKFRHFSQWSLCLP